LPNRPRSASDNALHGAGSDAELAGNLQDPVALGAKHPDAFFNLGIDARPAEPTSHRLAGRGRRIQPLLVQEQINALIP